MLCAGFLSFFLLPSQVLIQLAWMLLAEWWSTELEVLSDFAGHFCCFSLVLLFPWQEVRCCRSCTRKGWFLLTKSSSTTSMISAPPSDIHSCLVSVSIPTPSPLGHSSSTFIASSSPSDTSGRTKEGCKPSE